MTRFVVFCLVLACFAGAAAGENPPYLVKVGLDVDHRAPPATAADETKSCEGVTFSRNLRYGESERNVLDVATDGSNSYHVW